MRFSALRLPRRFTPDPLLHQQQITIDQHDDPIVALLRARRAEGSKPGERSDGHRVALVIEGGGMRGVVSAGMVAALEQLELTDCFDEVHGASAGTFAGAFLLARQATYLAGIYPHGFGNPEFVRIRHALRGGALFNLDHVINVIWREQRPLRTDRILSSPIEFHCTATDADSARIVDLTDLANDTEIRTAMLASSRLPWLAGGPVPFRGLRLLDATLAEAVPVHVAQTTATDMLVLQTRPHGASHTPLSGGVAKLTDRYLTKINPQLVELRGTRSQRYDATNADLTARAADPAAQPRVCLIKPPAGSPEISQIETARAAMPGAAGYGFRAAWFAFAGSDPEIVIAPSADL